MHINADKIATLHRGLHALGFLGFGQASLPNDHHGRPDFFYLQILPFANWHLKPPA